MLKRPQWVKEKIEGKEKQIPLQMTVKKKYSIQPDNSYMEMDTISAKNTGAGVDGKVQPGKMVDVQVHEGEGIIPNNAMQGLTGQEFQGLIDTLSSGKVNKNKLREAIGMPTVSEYQTGGTVAGYSRNRGLPTTDTEDNTTTYYGANTNTNSQYGTSSNSRSKGIPAADSGVKAVAYPNAPTDFSGQTIKTDTVQRDNMAGPTIQVAPTQAGDTIQTAAATRDTTLPTTVVKAPETQTEDTIQTQAVTRDTTDTSNVLGKVRELPPAATEATGETVSTVVTSPANEAIRVGLQNILKEAQGVSDVDRKIADFYLQNIDASNAANLRVLESQISADPEMSEQGKQAAIMGVRREAAAQRAQTVGELAVNAAQRASTASRDLVTYGGQVRTYEEITLPQSRQNMEINRRTFDEITLPKSQIEIEQMKNELGADNWDRIQSMINKGVSISRVNTELAKMGLPPLTPSEFIDMYEAGSLGERNWNRQLSAAETLIELGSYEAAATELSNLYSGVEFDFTKLATKEAAENFATGLSQMASYVAAGWDVEDAIAAARDDGALELMGIDENKYAQFFNASKINSIDAEWEEIEESKVYQEMLNSDNPEIRKQAEDLKQYVTGLKMGLYDQEILHEYQVYKNEKRDTENPTVYAKNEEEAQAKVDALGPGYSVKDTGMISATIKEEPTTELTTGTDLDAKWQTFKDSIPDEVDITQDLYTRWETWQEDNPNGKWADFQKTEPATNKLQTIKVGSNEELKTKEYSDMLFEAYKEDPESVKSSGYFFDLPDKATIGENIITTASETSPWTAAGGLVATITGAKASGKRTTHVSDSMTKTLDDSIGLFFESPDGKIVGQIVDWDKTASTARLFIKKANGETVPYVLNG